uniref:Redoxin domain-containing protein n=1 Tax=Schlesneria paludicola TaxID=360056 RepID=A0A7C2PEZ6_9PLAN
MRKSLSLVVTALLAGGLATAAELQSGLPKGEFVPAFTVLDCSGPSKGDELCYRCKYGNRPVVSIFTRELTPEVTQLTKAIDAAIAKNEDAKMAGFVVLLTDNAKAAASKLEETAAKNSIKNVPLTAFDGTTGPKPYKISDKAEVTVMMWVDSEVKVSKGFGKGELNKAAIDQILADTKTILE